jgi:hypothetical protein
VLVKKVIGDMEGIKCSNLLLQPNVTFIRKTGSLPGGKKYYNLTMLAKEDGKEEQTIVVRLLLCLSPLVYGRWDHDACCGSMGI